MAGKSPKDLRAENERLSSEVEELRLRLEEAEQALEAIRTGQAESLVVEGPNGPRIFSLEGADHSYRVLVEAMNEGAATLSEDGTILYCNARFAEMLDAPLEQVMGSAIRRFLPEHSQLAFEALVREANGGESRGELALLSQGGVVVPAILSVSVIHDDTRRRFCLVAADLRAQKRSEEVMAAERFARLVLEQAADAIVVCDESGMIIRASDSARELCARDPLRTRFEDAFPLVLPDAGTPGEQPGVGLRAMRGEFLHAVRASLRRPDRANADVLVSAKGLHGSGGHTLGFVVTLVDVTERVQAENKLAKAKDQLELTLDSITDGYYALDQDWRFVAANRVAEEHFGKAEKDLLRIDIWTLSGVPDDCLLRRKYAEAIASGQAVHFEAESHVRPGFWAEMHLYPRPEGVLEVYFRDISSRKNAENALRLGEERLRLALEGAHEGTWDWDLKSKALLWDERTKDLFGLAPDAAIDFDRFMAAIHPEDRHGLTEVIDAAIHERTDVQLEYRVMRADGAVRWLHARCRTFCDENGDPRRMSGVVLDITERKQAEEALRESEERARRQLIELQSIYASAHVGLCVFDRNLRYIRINQRLAEINGVPVAGHIGKTVDEVVPALAATAREMAERIFATGEGITDIEVSGITDAQPGVQRTWMEQWLPLKDPAGAVTGINVVVEEITESKRAEEALRAANLALAEAAQRKNEFLAVLSHELRNPLAPIRNSTYILERAAPGGGQAKRALEVIDRQTGQLARLVDDLLDVTRITRNKVRLQRQSLELNELVRSTMEDQRSLFEKAQVRLELHPAPRPVFVNGDSNRLAQVIGNLLQNAAKFTPRGGETRIAITTDATEKRAVIRVSDTGVGMAPEMVSRLFEPFSQADSTLDRSKGGLGLGLALVKGLVELHGGDVTAHSAGLGKGAEFVIRLPLALAEAAAPQAGEAATGRRRRVLVIEDNVDAADSLCEVLEFSQHEVAAAYNGPEGVAKAHEFRPDVVLCDIGLPGMDGYEVARALRADDALKGIFLVALSGYALPEDLQRAQDAGFDRHLAKPPSLEKLEALLADAPLRSTESRGADSTPPPDLMH